MFYCVFERSFESVFNKIQSKHHLGVKMKITLQFQKWMLHVYWKLENWKQTVYFCLKSSENKSDLFYVLLLLLLFLICGRSGTPLHAPTPTNTLQWASHLLCFCPGWVHTVSVLRSETWCRVFTSSFILTIEPFLYAVYSPQRQADRCFLEGSHHLKTKFRKMK